MTTAASPSTRRASVWLALGGGIVRALRSPGVRALIGGQLSAALVILLRSSGLLQPLELIVYDTLLSAWSHPMARERIVLVGQTERDVGRWDYPLPDDLFADLLERLASWHPRVIAVDIYRDRPVRQG